MWHNASVCRLCWKICSERSWNPWLWCTIRPTVNRSMVTFGFDIGLLLIKEGAPLAAIIGLLLIKSVITSSYNMGVLLTKKLVACNYDVLLLKTKGLNDPNLLYHCHKWRWRVSYFEGPALMLAGKLVIQAKAFQYLSWYVLKIAVNIPIRNTRHFLATFSHFTIRL